MRYMAGVRMWDASYRKCVPGGSTPSATGGLSDVASGVWYAPAHTYNSAPGKVILDQSVEALPVRCSGIRDRPAATCKCCDRRSVATAEDVLSHFIHRGKLRFPQLGGWLSFHPLEHLLDMQPMLRLHSNNSVARDASRQHLLVILMAERFHSHF